MLHDSNIVRLKRPGKFYRISIFLFHFLGCYVFSLICIVERKSLIQYNRQFSFNSNHFMEKIPTAENSKGNKVYRLCRGCAQNKVRKEPLVSRMLQVITLISVIHIFLLNSIYFKIDTGIFDVMNFCFWFFILYGTHQNELKWTEWKCAK